MKVIAQKKQHWWLFQWEGITEILRNGLLYHLMQNEKYKIYNMFFYRLAEPHEMSGVVAFLVSDDASYITGEILVAAGGMPSRL